MELWRAIPGYEESYEASTAGNIRSIDRVDTIGRNRKGKVLSPATKANRYLMVLLRKDGKSIGCHVHRLVAQTFLPNPDNKEEVNHINNVRNDNRVGNLEWNTRKENLDHLKATNPAYVERAVQKKTMSVKQAARQRMFDRIIHDIRFTDMKFGQIAKKHGIAGSEVTRANTGVRYFREGLVYPLRKTPEIRNKIFIKMLDEGRPYKEARVELGMTVKQAEDAVRYFKSKSA